MIKNIDPNSKTTVTNTPDDPIINEEILDTILGTITPGTEIDAGDTFFPDEIDFRDIIPEPERGALCVVSFSFSGNDSKISYSTDGVNYDNFYEGVTLKAGSRYEPPFHVEDNSEFNMKTSEDITITRCVLSIKAKQTAP